MVTMRTTAMAIVAALVQYKAPAWPGFWQIHFTFQLEQVGDKKIPGEEWRGMLRKGAGKEFRWRFPLRHLSAGRSSHSTKLKHSFDNITSNYRALSKFHDSSRYNSCNIQTSFNIQISFRYHPYVYIYMWHPSEDWPLLTLSQDCRQSNTIQCSGRRRWRWHWGQGRGGQGASQGRRGWQGAWAACSGWSQGCCPCTWCWWDQGQWREEICWQD